MYDILELKSKLLSDLQDIAKNLNVPKYRSLKKMDLIYQILDVQAINPNATKKKKITSNINFLVDHDLHYKNKNIRKISLEKGGNLSQEGG